MPIDLFNNNAILDARIPPPSVRASAGPCLARRLAAVNAFWGATLDADPVVLVTDANAPGPGPQQLDSDAVEGALSAYAWRGLSSDDAYNHVLELVLSGLGDHPAEGRAQVLALLEAYFR